MLDHIIHAYDNGKHGSKTTCCIRDYVLDNKILKEEEWTYLESHYGYSAELIHMNLKEAMVLVKDMRSHKKYFGIKGGFSLITDKLEEKIRNMGGQIQFNTFVTNIQPIAGGSFLVHTKKPYLKLSAKKCVLAIPKRALLSMPILSTIRENLNAIDTTPLCRIYALYDKDPASGSVWFQDIKKVAVPNKLRLTIPIDTEKGVIMISYTDDKYAKWWKDLYMEHGKKRVIKELTKITNETFSLDLGGSRIPAPKDIVIAYWEDGVASWKSGTVHSDKIAKEIARPFGEYTNLYICGENYSIKQQWIEGALSTCPSV
jgi:hypothetical protein